MDKAKDYGADVQHPNPPNTKKTQFPKTGGMTTKTAKGGKKGC